MMAYRNFRVNIFIRVVLIVALALALAYVVTQQPSFFLPLTIIILLIAAVTNLIYYIEKFNRGLTHFLLSIRQGGFTEVYGSSQTGKPFEALSGAMNDIISEFAKLNEEKELHYQYLQTLNEQINVAIFSFEIEGRMIMMNPAAKRLLNHAPLNHLNDFKRIDEKLHMALVQIAPDTTQILPVIIGEEQIQLSIQSKEIVLRGRPVRIILLQNLSNELESKEIEAWQRLTRVLTHEIMNSVTPISALTTTMQKLLVQPNGIPQDFKHLTRENVDDIYSSLNTVSARAKGLLRFVQAFKEFSQPVSLKLESFNIVEMLREITHLFSPDLQLAKIAIEFYHDTKSISTVGDRALLAQVFINLIKNSIDALPVDGTGVISIYIHLTEKEIVRITIADNGKGIDEDILEKIFVPFFTTKSKGSGIGLSFSKQIIKLHHGRIKVQTTVGEGTVFTIELRSRFA